LGKKLQHLNTVKFVPALGYKWLTRFYDFFASSLFPEKKIKESFVRCLNLTGNEKILDFGFGTGTLCIMIKKEYPGVTMIGIDVDPQILAIARNKIAAQQIDIRLEKYDGENIPAFEGVQFDRINFDPSFPSYSYRCKKNPFSPAIQTHRTRW